MLQIGPYRLASRVVLAPMAGVTDLPFRQLCRRFGAGLVVSEMVTSDSRLWHTTKSRNRLNHTGEAEPRSVQIAGGEAAMMAEAAQLNVARGAQIIDINMGCPAKKVCKKAAGSALLKDQQLVTAILQAVVAAVDVPVTLKIRTGWSTEQRNGLDIARIAEDCGVSALAVHGRTRACKFNGEAEYDTIAAIKAAVSIPVIANGDIDSPQKALQVMQYTGADAIMIGRAAQGRPWLCREIDQYLRTGVIPPPPGNEEVQQVLIDHLQALHAFYGEFMGVKIARKHVGWYLKGNEEQQQYNSAEFRSSFNQLETAQSQQQAIEQHFRQLAQQPTINYEDGIVNNDQRADIKNEVIAA
ncbi:MAG: tRNA dihydrouridine synthase DusB [Spongiibacteraceae bacterium]